MSNYYGQNRTSAVSADVYKDSERVRRKKISMDPDKRAGFVSMNGPGGKRERYENENEPERDLSLSEACQSNCARAKARSDRDLNPETRILFTNQQGDRSKFRMNFKDFGSNEHLMIYLLGRHCPLSFLGFKN